MYSVGIKYFFSLSFSNFPHKPKKLSSTIHNRELSFFGFYQPIEGLFDADYATTKSFVITGDEF